MTVPILPAPPSRADPANFVNRADAWNAALAAFSAEVSELGQNYEASVTTVIAGLGAQKWVSGTTYAIGDLRFSLATGLLFRRLTNGAGTTDPASDTTNWALQTVAAPTLVVVSGTTQTAVKGAHYEMTNAAASTLTLPASPAVGDWVWVGFTNGRRDNTIARNGALIMGLAENLTVDWPLAGMVLRYISAGFGWRVFK
jgi:hypothetical protein